MSQQHTRPRFQNRATLRTLLENTVRHKPIIMHAVIDIPQGDIRDR